VTRSSSVSEVPGQLRVWGLMPGTDSPQYNTRPWRAHEHDEHGGQIHLFRDFMKAAGDRAVFNAFLMQTGRTYTTS
jgi:hypothetical protein